VTVPSRASSIQKYSETNQKQFNAVFSLGKRYYFIRRQIVIPELPRDLAGQLEVEAELKKALEDAKSAYEAAKKEFRVAMEHCDDLGLTHPDGATSFSQVAKAHNHTFVVYSRALFAFNHFILRGKLPED
jgi:hypothetical protein